MSLPERLANGNLSIRQIEHSNLFRSAQLSVFKKDKGIKVQLRCTRKLHVLQGKHLTFFLNKITFEHEAHLSGKLAGLKDGSREQVDFSSRSLMPEKGRDRHGLQNHFSLLWRCVKFLYCSDM